MRVLSSVLRLASLPLALAFASVAQADEPAQLIDSINSYRSQPQKCDKQVSLELPPLVSDPRLVLPATGSVDLRSALAQANYPMVSVRPLPSMVPRTLRPR